MRNTNIPIEDISLDIPLNTHVDGTLFQSKFDKFTKKGLVGISLVVDDPKKEFWAGAAGKARMEDNTAMTKNHLLHSASVAKMYTGTAIMLLEEDGLINLHDKVSKYLPSNICNKITNGNKITIHQLMSHTSGLYNWMDNPQERFDYLSDPHHTFSAEEILEYLYDKPAQFAPGQCFSYSNSNMVLLAIIIDYITKEDHSVFFRDRIFTPLGLANTYYRIQESYPFPLGTTNSYSNYYNDDRIINITDFYGKRWCSMIGDDGIIASVYDYIKFAKSLFEGEILKPASLEKMQHWITFGPGYDY